METTNWTKKSVTQVTMPKGDAKKGFEIIGTFQRIADKPYETINKESGEIEEKVFRQVVVEREGELLAYPCDAGLAQQLETIGLQQGDLFKAVNMGKQEMKGGRTINVWDVFLAGN